MSVQDGSDLGARQERANLWVGYEDETDDHADMNELSSFRINLR